MATLRKDGRWMARPVIDGKVWLAYGPTNEEAEERARAKAEAARQTRSTAPSTLHDFAKSAWLPTLKHKSESTRKRYEDLYVLHIREQLGNLPIRAITFQDCQGWVNRFQGSPASCHLAHCVLTQILRLAADIGTIPRNPAYRVALPPKPEKRERILTVDQAAAVLERTPMPLNRGVRLAMLLGLRLGEVCGLRWDNLDRQTGTLKIVEQAFHVKAEGVKGGGLSMRPLKTRGSKRKMILPKSIIAEIDRTGDLDSEWIAARDSKQYPPETLSEHWRDWRRDKKQKDLGLQEWHFHDLRHSAAQLLYAAGVDVAGIAAVLGHRSIDMTYLYLSLQEEQRKDAMERLAAALKLPDARPHDTA